MMARDEEKGRSSEAPGEPSDADQGRSAAEELIDRATEALAAGQVGQALRLARQATEAAPDLPAVWALLGTVAEEAGDDAEALEAYRQALRLDPQRPGLAEHVAELEARVAEEQEAAAEEQVAPQPASAVDRYAPAFLAASVALLVLAIGLAVVARGRRAASLEERYSRVMQLGKEYMARQQYDLAEAAFSDALRLKPGDEQAQSWLQRAQQGRQMVAALQQWRYATAGGKFPGMQGSLPPAQITPTRQRRQQEQQQAQAASSRASRRPRWTPRRYTWTAPSTGNYPSPRQEFGPPEFTQPQQGAWGPVPPAAAQPPTPLGAPGTAGAGQQGQVSAGGTAGQQAAAQAGAAAEEGAPEKPRGYLRIVVGEPRAAARQESGPRGPSADAVREQADALRRAGQTEEAKRLYRQAIELYRQEAKADPTARAVKEAGIESCRRALEQCE